MVKPSLEPLHRVETHIAAVLAADMVGYTQHMCRDEAGTLSLLKSLRRDLLYPNTNKHGGRVVKSSGDGVIVEFSSASHAVLCAIELQRSVMSFNENTEESRRVFFRMGVCLGDISVDLDGDIYGNSVNLASRLEGIAPSGGICLTQAVLDQVRDKINCDPVSWGLVQLKNVNRAVQVFVISPEIIAQQAEVETPYNVTRGYLYSQKYGFLTILSILTTTILLLSSDQLIDPSSTAYGNAQGAVGITSVRDGASKEHKEITPRMSIVILPLKNPDGGLMEDRLAEEVAANITSELTRVNGIFVVSSSAAIKYQRKFADPEEIGKQLNVRYVFSGTMRHANGRLRVNAQLIDVSTGAQIWADRFKSRESSMDDIEDEIVDRLVRTLTSGIGEAEARRIQSESKIQDPPRPLGGPPPVGRFGSDP